MDVKAAEREREREESRDRTGLWIGCRGKLSGSKEGSPATEAQIVGIKAAAPFSE